jgi:hypothetical protein
MSRIFVWNDISYDVRLLFDEFANNNQANLSSWLKIKDKFVKFIVENYDLFRLAHKARLHESEILSIKSFGLKILDKKALFEKQMLWYGQDYSLINFNLANRLKSIHDKGICFLYDKNCFEKYPNWNLPEIFCEIDQEPLIELSTNIIEVDLPIEMFEKEHFCEMGFFHYIYFNLLENRNDLNDETICFHSNISSQYISNILYV